MVGRPPAERPDALWDFVDEMTSTIRRVMSRRDPQRPSAAQVRCDLDEGRDVHGPGPIIAIGASTGGPEAISVVLEQMPVDCPGIVISQHMPERFMRAFAARLDRRSSIRVKEADEGEPVRRGHAYLAPGDRHLLVHRHGGRDVIGLSTAPAVNHHRPSVDVMFHALAASAPERVVGLLLTGMGRDGAAGLLALKRGGATTLVQDETSCVVYGMPKAAVAIGGVDEICPLAELAGRALSAASTHRLRRGRGSKIRSA